MKSLSHPKLLLSIKQFFNESNRLTLLGDEFSSMKAILYMDFAIEQMLNVIIIDFNTDPKIDLKYGRDEVNWSSLWQNATQSIKDEPTITMKYIPRYKDLKTLHEVRNLIQHRGHIPSASDVSRCLGAAKEMISTCFYKCYGFNFQDFRLIDAVKNPQLRRLLKESEEALNQDIPIISLAGSMIAFRKIINATRSEYESFAFNKGFGPGFEIDLVEREMASYLSSFSHEISDKSIIKPLSELVGNTVTTLISQIRALRDDSEVANLGLSMAETKKFRKIGNTLGVNEGDDGSWEIIILDSTLDYKEYAKFALNYLSSLVLLSQEVSPEAIDSIEILIPLTEQGAWKQSISSRKLNKKNLEVT